LLSSCSPWKHATKLILTNTPGIEISIAQAKVQPEMLHVNEHNVNTHMQQNP
jgi:hypothetical protein